MKLLSVAVALCAAMFAQNSQKDAHHDAVDRRGDHVMGFSHEKTTHHFRLYSDGGSIEVSANDPKDDATIDQIRMHLSHIAGMFTAGNFDAPILIHDRTPPGVTELKRLRSEVRYQFEKTGNGGRVLITTGNAGALRAVHEFLRFQIADHRTGDPAAVSKRD